MIFFIHNNILTIFSVKFETTLYVMSVKIECIFLLIYLFYYPVTRISSPNLDIISSNEKVCIVFLTLLSSKIDLLSCFFSYSAFNFKNTVSNIIINTYS